MFIEKSHKDHIIYNSIYIKYLELLNSYRQKVDLQLPMTGGDGVKGSECSWVGGFIWG